MQSKTTPGKWFIDKPNFEVINIVTENDFICEIPCPIDESEDSAARKEQAESNARLLAASKDLLKALLNIIGTLEEQLTEDAKENESIIEAMEEANAVIQKATN